MKQQRKPPPTWKTMQISTMLRGKIGNIDLDQFHIKGMELLNNDNDESILPMWFESVPYQLNCPTVTLPF